MPRFSASVLTAVGLTRVSIGPPISVMEVRHIGIVVGLHQRDRGKHRHRRLANGDHVDVAAERMQHRDHVVDIVVEIEPAFRQRHRARVCQSVM